MSKGRHNFSIALWVSIFGPFFPLNLYLQLLEEKGQGHNLMNLDVSLIWVSLQPLGKTLPYAVKRVINREPGDHDTATSVTCSSRPFSKCPPALSLKSLTCQKGRLV